MVSFKERRIQSEYTIKCFQKCLKNLEEELPPNITLDSPLTTFLGKLYSTGFRTGINYNRLENNNPERIEERATNIKIEKVENYAKKTIEKHPKYERIGVYKIEDVLPYIVQTVLPRTPGMKKQTKEYDGHIVNMVSKRYQTFKIKGLKCVTCGLEGKFFSLERHFGEKKPHFNLYAVDENGYEVLMTKDHIHPKGAGGSNCIDNLQTMCTRCNQKKSITEDKIKIEQKILEEIKQEKIENG